jgi:hypothetical protein
VITRHFVGIAARLPPIANVIQQEHRMRVPSWLIVIAAVIMALPFGWGLGVAAAELALGPNFGQLPALTVPVAIVGSIVFALTPAISPSARLAIMTAGTALFLILAAVFP